MFTSWAKASGSKMHAMLDANGLPYLFGVSRQHPGQQ